MNKYKDAGVDVETGYEAVRLMKKHVAETFRPEVLADIGGFATGVVDKSKTINGQTGIYVKIILDLISRYTIKGIVHITGGGFVENIPRVVPEGLGVKINKGSWPVHPIFGILQKAGNIEERDMYSTFNMGIGMVVVVDRAAAANVVKYLGEKGEKAYDIGEITRGGPGVEIC